MKETSPVKFKEANFVWVGCADVAHLPVHWNGENLTSCWKIPFWKRFRVLLTGRIYLVIKGRIHPSVWIDTKAFMRKS